jgi:hypothetical protein
MSDDMKAPERIWIDDERPYGGECHLSTEADIVPGFPLSIYGVEYIRADRIEQLERERDEIDALAHKYMDRLEQSEAKLAKAVEALRDTAYFMERHSNRWDGVNGKHPAEVMEAARAALAELEK